MSISRSFLCLLLLASLTGHSQRYSSGKATVSFTVSAPAKEISGTNAHAVVEADFSTGKVKAQVVVDSFGFRNNFIAEKMNAVIRQRFREYYMESALYPLITFEGKITNLKTVAYKKNGTYPLVIPGYLTIHGVRKQVAVAATLTVDGASRSIVSDFVVVPEDYKIRVPDYIGYMYFGKVNIRIAAEL